MNQWNRGWGQRRKKAEEKSEHLLTWTVRKKGTVLLFIYSENQSQNTQSMFCKITFDTALEMPTYLIHNKSCLKKIRETAPVCLNHRFRSNMFQRDHHHQGPFKNSTAKVTELHETEIMGQIWLNDRPFQSLKFPPQEIRK